MAKNKMAISSSLMQKYHKIFSCPICGRSMQIMQDNRLVCATNHSFDLARQGYINLLTKAHQTKYSKQLFISRRTMADSGFFAPLNKTISNIIVDNLKAKHGGGKILDTGSGEGSHLAKILAKTKAKTTRETVAVGIDIAKEGMQMAARDYQDIIWCVADLTNCPFQSGQFDCVLNILSPSNATEFNRLLTDDGLVIKVVPSSNYLREMREILYRRTDQQSYSNQNTVALFSNSFKMIDIKKLRYPVSLAPHLVEPLIDMTPLSWSVAADRLQELIDANLSEVTVDFDILIGKKKHTFH